MNLAEQSPTALLVQGFLLFHLGAHVGVKMIPATGASPVADYPCPAGLRLRRCPHYASTLAERRARYVPLSTRDEGHSRSVVEDEAGHAQVTGSAGQTQAAPQTS